MKENKVRTAISMDPQLAERIKAVSEHLDEGFSTTIERMCLNEIDSEERRVKLYENAMFQKVAQVMTYNPRVFEAIAKLVGEQLEPGEAEYVAEHTRKSVELGTQRRNAKRKISGTPEVTG